MPTYEYLCKSCGERFEKFQSFSAKPLKTHDACGGEVQKVFHASGVVFKGSGFYATDSRAAARASSESAGDGPKESGSRDSGDGAKDSGSKESSSKESGSKEPSGGSKTSTKGSKSSSAPAGAAAAD